ncbi:MAG: FG-GAP-like repeat-containing protein [Flavobacteriales bacterium]
MSKGLSFLILSVNCMLLLVISEVAYSQFELFDTGIELTNGEMYPGPGISLADFDKDGWDDITTTELTVGVVAYRNMGDGTFGLYHTFSITPIVNHVLWIDFDNDGDRDLFCAIRDNFNRLFRNDGNDVYTDISIQIRPVGPNSDSMGSTWGDYDRDGYVDLYVSNNDDFVRPNWLWHNNGDGTFDEVATDVGLNYGLENTLQSTWLDVNMDGWQDLYISEDRNGPNKLFINNQGTFTDMAPALGADAAIFSMSNTLGDFDNDGDFDIYCTNNDNGNVFYRNDNGVFVDIADTSGVAVNNCCWAGVWVDYDHDGNDDLYVCQEEFLLEDRQNSLFYNLGDGSFEAVNGYGLEGDNYNSFAAGKFDFDNDFKWDLAVTNTDPMSISAWWNSSESGNAVKMGFEGVISNTDGIGTIAKAYHNGTVHMLQTYCGENFLAQESSYEMISLGGDTLIDSLIVIWPSCWIDRYYNLPANHFFMFTEGETFQNEITSIGPGQICPEGGSVILDAGNFESYSWSTLSEGQQITATESGTYWVAVTNTFGLSDTAYFEVTIFATEYAMTEVNPPACSGDTNASIEILNNESFLIAQWNETVFDSVLTSLGAGDYTLFVTELNGCTHSEFVQIPQTDPLIVSIQADSILCYGGTTNLIAQATGGTGDVYFSWNTPTPEVAVAGNYECLGIDAMGCYYTSSISIEEPTPVEIVNLTDTACYNETVAGIVEINGGTPGYVVEWSASNPEELSSATYTLTVTDTNQCQFVFDIAVEEFAELSVMSNFINPNGGANGQIELVVIGGQPPFTYSWSNESTDNPMTNVVQGIYQCTITDANGCVVVSDSISLIDAGISEKTLSQSVFPNPFDDLLHFSIGAVQCKIVDSSGKLMFEGKVLSNGTIDTSRWPAGQYLMYVPGYQTTVLIKD